MHYRLRTRFFAVFFVCAFVIGSAPAGADPVIFGAMAGKWRGWGDIQLHNGRNERVRCYATYTLSDAGRRLSQALRCAGTAFTFDVAASLRSEGTGLVGEFRESNKGISGQLTGQANGHVLDLVVTGAGYSASMQLTVNDASQLVKISTNSSDVREISVKLNK